MGKVGEGVVLFVVAYGWLKMRALANNVRPVGITLEVARRDPVLRKGKRAGHAVVKDPLTAKEADSKGR